MTDFSLSEYIFEAESYTQFLASALAGTPKLGVRKPRGSLIALAQQLNCHTSFISQVLAGKAHFNTDQALLTAEYFDLTGIAQDHWIDLVLRERSGTQAGQQYFTRRLTERIASRKNLSLRWQSDLELNELECWQFFSTWLPQVLHSVLHLPKHSTVDLLAKALQISAIDITSTLELLERLQLVKKIDGHYLPQNHWMHLSKKSPVIRLHHQSWRLRSIEEFSRPSELKGFHYSGALTLSRKDAEQIHSELLQLMDNIRSKVAQSSSEEAYGRMALS